MIEVPKYLMLNGKKAFPNFTYENFLIDVLNFSRYFCEKKPDNEAFELVKKQSHGENDAYSSTYQLDFKLIVDQNVMCARNNNCPCLDYSMMKKGLIISKSKSQDELVDIPNDTILADLLKTSYDDLKNGKYESNSIKRLAKNMCKPKNLFLYYPYEFHGITKDIFYLFEKSATLSFSSIMRYRYEQVSGFDTFLCYKIDSSFVIWEWFDDGFVMRDSVNELLCTNYRDLKTYSIY